MTKLAPLYSTVRSTTIAVFLALAAIIMTGCAERDLDKPFPQQEAVGMDRDELWRTMKEAAAGADETLCEKVDFFLDDNRQAPYLSPEYRASKNCYYSDDELRNLGYRDDQDLPEAYFTARRWKWNPPYGRPRRFEYYFDDRDVVDKVIVSYYNEAGDIVQAFFGFYLLGSVFSAIGLLYAFRHTMRHRPARKPWRAPGRFYIDAARDGGIALLAGTIAVMAAAAVVDPEVALAAAGMALPLLASLTLYYCMLWLTGSRLFSL
ncbi:MAG: hypothetical protein JW959_13525 [Pirellulales bacterium]|nr:hypothetical protein [Pirellulales bacterium]